MPERRSCAEPPRCSGAAGALPAGVAGAGGDGTRHGRDTDLAASRGRLPGSEPRDGDGDGARREGCGGPPLLPSRPGLGRHSPVMPSPGRQGRLTQPLKLPPLRSQHHLFNHFPKLI